MHHFLLFIICKTAIFQSLIQGSGGHCSASKEHPATIFLPLFFFFFAMSTNRDWTKAVNSDMFPS
jgi:hypothetical protein